MQYETMEEALRDLVRALGGTKAVGGKLFPAMPVEQAASRVSDSLNPERRQHFALHELVYLLRMASHAGHHSAMEHLCDVAGYEHPRPARNEQELAELQAAVLRATAELRMMAQRIESLSSTKLRSV